MAESKTCVWAILSLIFAFFMPLIGLIFGIVALIQINKDKSLKGKGLAIAGIVISSLWMVLILLLFIIGLVFTFGVFNAMTPSIVAA
jgi:ABC-type dipeptide/oligopeptide/nickel transport system permease component